MRCQYERAVYLSKYYDFKLETYIFGRLVLPQRLEYHLSSNTYVAKLQWCSSRIIWSQYSLKSIISGDGAYNMNRSSNDIARFCSELVLKAHHKYVIDGRYYINVCYKMDHLHA